MATAHRPPGPYDHPPPGSYDHGPPGSYDHGPPGSYDHPPPGSYDHGPPGSYDHGPPGSYDHEPQYHDLHPDLHEEPYYDQDMPPSATASSSHVHNHRNSHQQQSPGPMPMDPATELAHLKFTPRTSAWKHMQRFERLCGLAYPRATDAGKWSLFVKTIDTTNVWGSGRGMTPGRWLMELSEDWLRKNPQCSQPDCLECKHESMTFDHLKNAFLDRWGSPREKPFTHPARSHSLPPSSELGSPGVEFGHESRDSRDRDSDTSLDRALIPHSHHNCGGNHLPAAPTPPNEPTNERERIVQETKTSIAINAHPGTGQIVLQISDKNTTGGGGRKRKGGTEVRAVIDPPQPLAVEAPPPPEPEPPRQLQIVQVIEASPEPPLELKHEEPPTPHAIEAPPSVDDMAVEEPLALTDSTTDCAPQGPPMRARLLEGKVCAITGASRGIGRAIALGFAKEGANIIAHYWGTKSDPANEEIVSLCVEVRGMGQGCTIVFGDISDPRTSDNIIKRAVETYGKIDVAVGNAGMCWYRDFLDVTPELLRRHVDVNLNGNFYFVQAAARQFKAQFHSEPVEPRPDPMPDYSIITISSSSALSNTSSSQAHFNPTAAGITSLMQSTAIALGPYGVRCNALLPGTIQTKMNKEDLQDMEKRGRLEKKVPLGRLGVPSDVVGPAVWLAGEGARYVSGAQILVDGGAFVNG